MKKINKKTLNQNLIRSVGNNDLKSVKKWIELGADVHVGDDLSLRWSLYGENFEVAEYLVDNGADFEKDNIRIEHKEFLKKYVNLKNFYKKLSMELTSKNNLNVDKEIVVKL